MQAARSDHTVRPEYPQGFTLVELMIVVCIIAVISGIAIPLYTSAVLNARVVKCKEELRTISRAVDVFSLQHHAVIPATLHEVGHGGRLDPWGYKYMYLNFQTGTGSGMEWAIENNLADPNAQTDITGTADYESAMDGLQPVPDLDASTEIEVDKVTRKDKFLFPLNTDYDLFSLGPNGKSAPSLGDLFSLDDVIRANNGGFFGRAKDY